jgi:hypothetical protein
MMALGWTVVAGFTFIAIKRYLCFFALSSINLQNNEKPNVFKPFANVRQIQVAGA